MILAHRSAYFAARFKRATNADAPVSIVDFSASIFRHLLLWMYTGAARVALRAPVPARRRPAGRS